MASLVFTNLLAQSEYSDKMIKELWQKDSCGVENERSEIKNYILSSKKFNKKNINEVKELLGYPIKSDTIENGKVLVFYYIVDSLYFDSCSCWLKDLAQIGSVSIYFRKNRIINIEFGME
jgi:hypothetical protein